MNPVIIEGLLRQGETMSMIGPAKCGMSWLSLQRALPDGNSEHLK